MDDHRHDLGDTHDLCCGRISLPQPVDADELPDFLVSATRRTFVKRGVAAGVGAALAASVGARSAEAKIIRQSTFAERILPPPRFHPHKTSMILLGAGGGPDAFRLHGCSAAVWVRGSVYLVDFGIGMHRQFMRAQLHPKNVRAAFVTHLHSDHMHDVYPFFTTAYYYLNPPYTKKPVQIKIFGPGSAATHAPNGSNGLPSGKLNYLLNPANPTPGLGDVMKSFVIGPYAYDNNIRARDEGMPDMLGLTGGTPQLVVNELPVPSNADYLNVAPPMSPVDVYEDENVKVRAILVNHGLVFPAYAFRFQTPHGSITFSGDTANSANLLTIAHRTDLLVHEVIHLGYVEYFVKLGAPPALVNHFLTSHTPDRSVNNPKFLKAHGVGAVAKQAHAKRLLLYHLVPTMDYDAKGRPYDIAPREWLVHPRAEFGGPVNVGEDLLRIDL